MSGDPHASDNQNTVLAFIELVFQQGRVREGVEAYVAADCIQHDPRVRDGREGDIEFFEAFWQRYPGVDYRVQHVIASGDLVCVHGKSVRSPELPTSAIFDLFRLQDGKIVEHWDAIEFVPTESVNAHPMF